MTKRLAMSWGVAFLLAACAAPAREAGAGGEAQAQAPAKPKDKGQPKMVCEDEETVGTHFTRRVCHRVDDRDLQRDMTQDAMRSNYGTNTKQGG